MIENKKKKLKVGRPFKDGMKRARMSLTLHPVRFAWLHDQARQNHTSLSEYLDQLILEAQKQKSIETFCKKNHIKKFALFGSVLRKDFSSSSDVDVLVEFFPDHEPGYFGLSALAQELSKIFGGKKIDLRTKAELSRYFRDQVSQEAKTLYAY
jgi:predicted nucleotidyltransferase